ncbi:hypothetical protein MMC09_005026 [Bachmanniomyces sp. S44760]|nr:hypothetical protein [Bachmanniomyces sp. S44760]
MLGKRRKVSSKATSDREVSGKREKTPEHPGPDDIQPSSASLYVALYDPRYQGGDISHWALHLDLHGYGHVLYEVIGGPGEFRLAQRTSAPDRSTQLRESVFVADIDGTDNIAHYYQIVANTNAIQNDIALWNCQQWVMDILETLQEEDIIDDYRYHNSKEELEARFYRSLYEEDEE